jgi:hypothetical protein
MSEKAEAHDGRLRFGRPSGSGRDVVEACRSIGIATGQNASTWDRTLRDANKIRQRFGGETGMAAPFPEKPKGIWRRTYERPREQALDAEIRADKAFALQVVRLLERIDKPNHKRKFWR